MKTKYLIFVQARKAEFLIIMIRYHTYHRITTQSEIHTKTIKSHTDLTANGFETLNINIWYILLTTSLQ